jgi:hypothetical protein
MFQTLRTVLQSAVVGCAGAIAAASLSPGTAAILGGQENIAISLAVFGFCGAQIGAALCVVLLIGATAAVER